MRHSTAMLYRPPHREQRRRNLQLIDVVAPSAQGKYPARDGMGPLSRIARPTLPHHAHDAPAPSGFTEYPIPADMVIIRAYYVMS